MTALVSVLSRHGFQDALVRMRLKPPGAEAVEISPADTASVYARIARVLQELGPTFVKLGQALSNRDDLLPRALTQELQQLQDNVEAADIDVAALLAEQFGPDYRTEFTSIETTPLASASIAQVYKAVLKTGEEVVLKVKRPHIQEVIEGDLLLMKDIARLLTAYFEFAATLQLEQAVATFEKSLMQELSFVHERENIERFAANFKAHPHLIVPKVYPFLSNNEVLCMEWINGAKITDHAFLLRHELAARQLAQRGLHLFLMQILEHGFFHADPHAGNIMVTPDGRLAFIDMGAMGRIYQADQELLEQVVINIITKNTARLVALLKKMAIRIEIKDERKLQDDLSEILRQIDANALEKIQITLLIQKFKEILFENRIIMPDYFTLLVRGMMLIESVGRALYPGMNIVEEVQPYMHQIIQKRLSPQYLIQKGISRLGELGQDAQNIPYELRNILVQLNEGRIGVHGSIRELEKTNKVLSRQTGHLILAILLGANVVATSVALLADRGPQCCGVSLFFWAGLATSGILGLVLVLKIMRVE